MVDLHGVARIADQLTSLARARSIHDSDSVVSRKPSAEGVRVDGVAGVCDSVARCSSYGADVFRTIGTTAFGQQGFTVVAIDVSYGAIGDIKGVSHDGNAVSKIHYKLMGCDDHRLVLIHRIAGEMVTHDQSIVNGFKGRRPVYG